MRSSGRSEGESTQLTITVSRQTFDILCESGVASDLDELSTKSRRGAACGRAGEEMDMRGIRYLAAVVAIIGLLTGSAVTAASAATSQGAAARAAAGVHLSGGTTAVTTAPGVASALLQNGIVPEAVLPGSEQVLYSKNGPAVRFAFPVTGGLVSSARSVATSTTPAGSCSATPRTGRRSRSASSPSTSPTVT